jgi:hypothetical protein
LFKWKSGQQQKEKGNDMRVRQWMYLHQSRRFECGGYVNNGDFVNSLAVKSSADFKDSETSFQESESPTDYQLLGCVQNQPASRYQDQEIWMERKI